MYNMLDLLVNADSTEACHLSTFSPNIGRTIEIDSIEALTPSLKDEKATWEEADFTEDIDSFRAYLEDIERNTEITNTIENTDIEIEEIVAAEVLNNDGISISAAELISREIEQIPCLVEPILHKTGLACIAGSSDTGKSSLLRYLCMCVVSGKSDFLGFPIHAEYKRAIYVSTEDDEIAISYLLRKQNEDLQEEASSLEGLRFVFDTENLIYDLDMELTKQPADLVCIDAFSDIYRKSMIEGNQVRSFLNEYSQLGQKHQCLMLFLHHCGKRTENVAPSKHNLLGSQSFEAKMRLVMELRNDLTDNTMKHLCIVKGNYLPSDHKNESYRLHFTNNMTFVNTGERIPFENLTKAACDRRPDLGETSEEDGELKAIFELILSDSAMSYSDLWNSIKVVCKVSKATAKRKISKALAAGIIRKDENGRYYIPREDFVDAVVVEEEEPEIDDGIKYQLLLPPYIRNDTDT